MVIEYDGTHFFGWQYQPNKRTVQGELQAALRKILGEEIKITGAGRTDQGVHALGQVANFRTNSDLPLSSIKKGVNALVGDDMYVKDIAVVADDFDSRYSARTKVYQYYLTLEPSPFLLRYNWYIKQAPVIEAMRKAMQGFLGQRDFKNFSVRNGSDNTECNIVEISVKQEGAQIVLTIEGNRFLRKMVRGIVGFLVDVGRGRFSISDVERHFNTPTSEINFAPPQGLFLTTVKY
jgi:tRNA pseudouridine38-40 synthase